MDANSSSSSEDDFADIPPGQAGHDHVMVEPDVEIHENYQVYRMTFEEHERQEREQRAVLLDEQVIPRQLDPDIPNYTRINFAKLNVAVDYELLGIGEILKTSPLILRNPNDVTLLMHLGNVTATPTDGPVTYRSVFGDRTRPLVVAETLAEISKEFLTEPLMMRKVKRIGDYETKSRSRPGVYTLEFEFNTTAKAFDHYKFKCNNGIWLMCSIEATEVNTNIKGDQSFLKDHSGMVFIDSLVLDDESGTAVKDSPVWPNIDGSQLPVDATLFNVKGTLYMHPPSDDEFFTKMEYQSEYHITFVSSITMYMRSMRMVNIPDIPQDHQNLEDYNVSIVYNSMIGIRFFDTDYCNVNATREDKLLSFFEPLASDRPKLSLVVGVPGSGKTSNTVTPVGTLLEKKKQERILMCAPSNAACDVFFSRVRSEFPELLVCRVGNRRHFTKTGLDSQYSMENQFRRQILRNDDTMERVTEKYNITREDLMHKGTQGEATFKVLLGEARLVVCTLGSSQCADLLYIRNSANFSTLIVDECTQAKLVELLMPLHFTSIKRVMLIGDPFQLGPVCVSKIVSIHALDYCSIFIRLFNALKDSPCVSQLTHQHRIHPIVAKLINIISYTKGGIVITTDEANGKYRRLVGKHPPLLLLSSTLFEDTQAPGSHSRISIKEAETTMFLLKASLCLAGFNFQTKKFPPDGELSYCIIPLYRGQVDLFEKIIRREQLGDHVKVCTVDQMQGSECDIAIVSAVRASNDLEPGIGFASDIRRLNVALSRAGAVYVLAQANSFKSREGWNKLFHVANTFGLLHTKAELLRFNSNGVPANQSMYNFIRAAGENEYAIDRIGAAFDRPEV